MTNQEIMRIAVRVGCSPVTVKSCLTGRRKTNPVLAAAILAAALKLGINPEIAPAHPVDGEQ